jgi:hypothetical protein
MTAKTAVTSSTRRCTTTGGHSSPATTTLGGTTTTYRREVLRRRTDVHLKNRPLHYCCHYLQYLVMLFIHDTSMLGVGVGPESVHSKQRYKILGVWCVVCGVWCDM